MAFTGFIDRNIGLEEGPGTAAANLRTWLNTLLQKDGTDYRLVLSQNGNNYLRYNSTNAAIELYVGGTKVQSTDPALGGGGLQKRTVTITHAELTEVTNNTPQVLNIGSVLPTGAIVVAHELNLGTAFSGGSASAVTLDIGGTDADAIVDGADLFTGAPAGARTGTAGVHTRGSFSAEQLVATFLTDSGHNLAGLSAGSVVITVWFIVLA